ncbi:MAG TPA: aminomethyl-transferring glycine dehydrogenase subunit GcvPA [Candidatus Micrarchaeia archaeon]|nr:aminomethyl-transferring glycine dehydrogenase subunit GcvPA [Candidatus Micrarchaeia archaeon]
MAYLPNTDADRDAMLRAIGVTDVETLFRDVPARLLGPALDLPPPLSEPELTAEMEALARRNRPLGDWDCFLGAGITNRFIPQVVHATIRRPEFATSYTPYQAEASQGYLQAIFEFQTIVAELYGLDVANASMYDGATATAEGALMAVAQTGRTHLLVSAACHPESLRVLDTYAAGRGVRVTRIPRRGATTDLEAAERLLAAGDAAVVVVAQPNFLGALEPAGELIQAAHAAGAMALVAADPVAAAVLEPPGALGADIAAGEGQPLGIPPQLGGPTVGLLACSQALLRRIPGRLVGRTTDARGAPAYCLTLQTREQHIRRERATSNICTNHALMALAATAYVGRLGAGGLEQVAEISSRRAHHLAAAAAARPGYALAFPGTPFLWEFALRCPLPAEAVAEAMAERGILAGLPLGGVDDRLGDCLLVCTTELTTPQMIGRFLAALPTPAAAPLAEAAG